MAIALMIKGKGKDLEVIDTKKPNKAHIVGIEVSKVGQIKNSDSNPSTECFVNNIKLAQIKHMSQICIVKLPNLRIDSSLMLKK